jgi:hypothetical protein
MNQTAGGASLAGGSKSGGDNAQQKSVRMAEEAPQGNKGERGAGGVAVGVRCGLC